MTEEMIDEKIYDSTPEKLILDMITERLTQDTIPDRLKILIFPLTPPLKILPENPVPEAQLDQDLQQHLLLKTDEG